MRSRSSKKPLKVAGFRDDETTFAGAATYRQWEFSYVPKEQRRQ
ncbi:protein of unknown function [Paraburkholderia kururiensis]